MNPNTALAFVPSSAGSLQGSALRAAELGEGSHDRAFSAALERELSPQSGEQSAPMEGTAAPGSVPPVTAARADAAADAAADAGRPLPEGGKARPPVAADTAAAATLAGQDAGPAIDAALETRHGSDGSEALPKRGAVGASDTSLAAMDVIGESVSTVASGDEEDAGPAEDETATFVAPAAASGTEPLFAFFSRTLGLQGIAAPEVVSSAVAMAAQTSRTTGGAVEAPLTDPLAATVAGEDARERAHIPSRFGRSLWVAADEASQREGSDAVLEPSALDAGTVSGDTEAAAEADVWLASAAQPATAAALVAGQGVQHQDVTRLAPQGASTPERTDALFAGTGNLLGAVVGSPEWFDQLGAGLRWQVGEGVSEARLRLNPAELGSLDVQVRVTERGAEVHFVAPHAHTREALEQGMQRLRESLDAQGLQLADASVSDGRGGQGGREQPASTNLPVRAGGAWGPEDDPPGDDPLPGARLAGRGLIDLYA